MSSILAHSIVLCSPMYHLTPEDIKEIDRLLNTEHYTYKMLQKKYNLGDYRFRKVLKANNIAFTKETPRYKNSSMSKKEITEKVREMFVEKDISGKLIAKELNVNPSVINSIVRENNFKRKSSPIQWTNKMIEALLFTYETYGTQAAVKRFGTARHNIYQKASLGRRLGFKPKDHFLPKFDKKE